MLHPVGLHKFAKQYPDGSSERRHRRAARREPPPPGWPSAAAPVVAVYATFLNRCLRQVLMDAALPTRRVTSCSTGR